jgi:hypothetical protein
MDHIRLKTFVLVGQILTENFFLEMISVWFWPFWKKFQSDVVRGRQEFSVRYGPPIYGIARIDGAGNYFILNLRVPFDEQIGIQINKIPIVNNETAIATNITDGV